jgi:hypothetical protein
MARAVIELSVDFSPVMQRLSQQIEGCALNTEAKVMAFRIRAMAVIIDSGVIKIHRAEDQYSARQLIERLKELLVDPDKKLTVDGLVQKPG